MDGYLAVALVLAGVGLVLLVAEFLVPTGGVLVVGGLACFVAAVGLILLYGETTEAAVAVIGLCIGVPAVGGAMFSAWRRLALEPHLDEVAPPPPAADPGQEKLLGRHGRTVSAMRPSGVVEFDGRRTDALTEGVMLDAGVWVKCVAVRAGTVVVRQVDPPNDLNEFDVGDLR